ncbi:MAG: ferrous iron transport protein B [Smithella sp.]|nr:ferrous iron transport protein B [Smithella sp.]MDM7987384.1 ferrous iron transport protein B [Smithella sp.]HOU51190.1 ferrous iron transport protein B [Smithella sp.]HQG65844.1 ferrous iron transport protein B [Smithella sp.]HQI72475.1 ferrous iron transport protein B [Smithella sp.]
MNEPVNITSLREGDQGVIHSIEGGTAITSRLAGLGIVVNAKFRVSQMSSGLIVIQVGSTRIALGQGEASKIMVYRTAAEVEVCLPPVEKEVFVALVGQPNVGKSTVFNILTGLSQHVGNWPGKTVEKKEGTHRAENVLIRIVDLPGTYSLTAFSEEERVTRDFIIQEKPDLVVLVLNAAALERGLYLLSEVLLLNRPTVVVVNMIDVASDQGIEIDTRALQDSLRIPVIPMVAKRNSGIRELVNQIITIASCEYKHNPDLPQVSSDHLQIYQDILRHIRPHIQGPYSPEWVAVKLMEGDPEVTKMVEAGAPKTAHDNIDQLLIKHEDALHAVVNGRYDWIEKITRAAVSRFKMGEVVLTDRIDHILTRPIFGIPVLLGVMALVFFLTYAVGVPLQGWLSDQLQNFIHFCEPFTSKWPAWISGLLLNGIIGGAGSVLTFLPVLLIFFTIMAILEDIGYMARAAFVMDRIMHLVGLHGKSFMPMFLGFGCNVPAVLGARIIETQKARLITLLLIPFVPCTARLAVLTLVSAAVFGSSAAYVSWSMVALNIAVLGIAGIFVNKTLGQQDAPFIMELPIYHTPDMKTILMVVWSRTLSFIRKAGTVILGVSMIIWLLSYFPDGVVEESFLAQFGKWLQPLGVPLGLDWKMITALLTGLIAKENVVATLGVLYAVGRDGLSNMLPTIMNHESAAAFLVVMMLFIPCAATIAVLKKEMNNNKWFYASIVMTLIVSYLGGIAAYNLVRWLGI